MSSLEAEELVSARRRLLRLHYESGAGHLGGALSCLDLMMVLFHAHLQPDDEFVLSKGHAVSALYATLWSVGELTEKDLQTFATDGTDLAGHPPIDKVDRIRFATGSLGHGLPLAAGAALAGRLLEEDFRVFCLTSDAEWQEGSTWEAFIFSCHHRLANLTVLVDDNGLQAFGKTEEVASMTPLAARFSGFDVEIDEVDGHDVAAIDSSLSTAQERFRIILLKTVKGARISAIEDRLESHYLPLTSEQYALALEEVGRS